MSRRGALWRLALVLVAYLVANWLDARGADYCHPMPAVDGADRAVIVEYCSKQ